MVQCQEDVDAHYLAELLCNITTIVDAHYVAVHSLVAGSQQHLPQLLLLSPLSAFYSPLEFACSLSHSARTAAQGRTGMPMESAAQKLWTCLFCSTHHPPAVIYIVQGLSTTLLL